MYVLLIFYLKHSQSNFFFELYSSFTATPPNVLNEQFLIEQTWRLTQEHKSLEQTSP